MRKQNNRDWWRTHPWRGCHMFAENRNANCHLLLAYENMHVVWYPDGSGIWGASADGYALFEALKAAGEDPSDFVFDFVEAEPRLWIETRDGE